MKKHLILYLCTFCALFSGCKDDTPDTRNIILHDEEQQSLAFAEQEAYTRINFKALEPWTITMIEPGGDWCNVYPVSGEAGDRSTLIKVEKNNTKADRSLTLVLRSGNSRRDIRVTQVAHAQLILSHSSLEISNVASSVEFTAKSNVPFDTYVPSRFAGWLSVEQAGASAANDGLTNYMFRVTVTNNRMEEDRHGEILIIGQLDTWKILVTQAGLGNEKFYESTDYTEDGKVLQLQRADKGRGINIVLLGDAFSDRLIADGTYEKTMRKALDEFFSIEPYASYRDMFNVYTVMAVSPNHSYFDGAKTALECTFNERIISGNNDKCMEYARKITGMDATQLDDALLIVILNTSKFGGTTYLINPIQANDYASGTGIAYLPLGENEDTFIRLLHHEAGGHGFAKLADEYISGEADVIPQNMIDTYRRQEGYGWKRNIDFTNDPSAVKWHRFITAPQYQKEGIGVFEGACTYASGIYRATERSMMSDNRGKYNAPSREAIYYRINKLAYGPEWKYDFGQFAEYDKRNTQNSPSAGTSCNGKSALLLPNPPPVVCERQL